MVTNGDSGRRQSRISAAILLGLALGCSAPPPDPADGPGRVTVEFRRAEREPADGLTPVEWPQTGETIYLHPTAVAGNADIAKASHGYDGVRDVLLLRFTKAGAEKM